MRHSAPCIRDNKGEECERDKESVVDWLFRDVKEILEIVMNRP